MTASFPANVPEAGVQAEAVRAAAPSRRHGLYWDKRRRRWELRLTISLGRNLIGKRVKFQLGRMGEEEAMRAREVVLKTLRTLKLEVRIEAWKGKHNARADGEGSFSGRKT